MNTYLKKMFVMLVILSIELLVVNTCNYQGTCLIGDKYCVHKLIKSIFILQSSKYYNVDS